MFISKNQTLRVLLSLLLTSALWVLGCASGQNQSSGVSGSGSAGGDNVYTMLDIKSIPGEVPFHSSDLIQFTNVDANTYDLSGFWTLRNDARFVMQGAPLSDSSPRTIQIQTLEITKAKADTYTVKINNATKMYNPGNFQESKIAFSCAMTVKGDEGIAKCQADTQDVGHKMAKTEEELEQLPFGKFPGVEGSAKVEIYFLLKYDDLTKTIRILKELKVAAKGTKPIKVPGGISTLSSNYDTYDYIDSKKLIITSETISIFRDVPEIQKDTMKDGKYISKTEFPIERGIFNLISQPEKKLEKEEKSILFSGAIHTTSPSKKEITIFHPRNLKLLKPGMAVSFLSAKSKKQIAAGKVLRLNFTNAIASLDSGSITDLVAGDGAIVYK